MFHLARDAAPLNANLLRRRQVKQCVCEASLPVGYFLVYIAFYLEGVALKKGTVRKKKGKETALLWPAKDIARGECGECKGVDETGKREKAQVC